MSTLVVVGYDNLFKAEEIRIKLQKMQATYLIDLEDAVVAIKNAKGKVKLDQQVNMTAMGAATGALRDVGINDQFMKGLASTMQPNSSALFVLIRKANPERVLEEL